MGRRRRAGVDQLARAGVPVERAQVRDQWTRDACSAGSRAVVRTALPGRDARGTASGYARGLSCCGRAALRKRALVSATIIGHYCERVIRASRAKRILGDGGRGGARRGAPGRTLCGTAILPRERSDHSRRSRRLPNHTPVGRQHASSTSLNRVNRWSAFLSPRRRGGPRTSQLRSSCSASRRLACGRVCVRCPAIPCAVCPAP